MDKNDQYIFGFMTKAIHPEGYKTNHSPYFVPIYATRTFTYAASESGEQLFTGEKKGYIYTRLENPTADTLSCTIARLEGHKAGAKGADLNLQAVMMASGMATISGVLFALLRPGDKGLTHPGLYGGTNGFLKNVCAPYGIMTLSVDLRSMDLVEDMLRMDNRIRVLYIESPNNPVLDVYDIESLAKLEHRYGAQMVCDNIFATPYAQQSFKWGADFVIHPTTRFLNGHGTGVNGVIGKDTEFMQKKLLKSFHLLVGIISPFDAFLVQTGFKTLPLRMECYTANATALVYFLKAQKKVEKVIFTVDTAHPNFPVVQKQMTLSSAIIGMELASKTAYFKFMNALKIVCMAVSLGTADTFVCHPFFTTHFYIPEAVKKLSSIMESLLRITVGLENIEDLIYDFSRLYPFYKVRNNNYGYYYY